MTNTITAADVGRTVRLWNDQLVKIKRWDETSCNPVILENDDDYTAEGFYYYKGEPSEKDIVAFADEPETQITFTRKSPMVNPTDFGEEDSEPSAPTDQHKQIWLSTFNAYLAKSPHIDHAAAAANAAVEAFKKFERGE